MCSKIYNYRGRWVALRTAFSPDVLLAGLVALLALFCGAPAQAQPPVGPTQVAAEEKIGVTLYQASGLHGKIPLKKVYKADPSGDTGQYVLEFASGNMNTKMDFEAKFVVPSGMVFTSFNVSTFNGPVGVTPAGADSWDGQTIIDKVTVSPWNMNHVLEQCIAHLEQPDGTFKDSATFDLQADITEFVRGKGICKFPNAPPGSASSYSAQVKPRTRVTAYIVEESRIGSGSREPKRLSLDQSGSRQPSGQSGTKHIICDDHKVIGTRPTSQGSSSPRPTSSGRVTAGSSSTAIKDTFHRPKPHVNVSDLPLKRGTGGRLPSPQP